MLYAYTSDQLTQLLRLFALTVGSINRYVDLCRRLQRNKESERHQRTFTQFINGGECDEFIRVIDGSIQQSSKIDSRLLQSPPPQSPQSNLFVTPELQRQPSMTITPPSPQRSPLLDQSIIHMQSPTTVIRGGRQKRRTQRAVKSEEQQARRRRQIAG